jgi:hypothetical protein
MGELQSVSGGVDNKRYLAGPFGSFIVPVPKIPTATLPGLLGKAIGKG